LCPENPYDGHTLEGQLDQVERLTGMTPAVTFVDKGDKGRGVPEDRSRVLISGTRKLGMTPKRRLRRRSAVEPEVGHMKTDGLLGRNFLKGVQGDAMNALLCGADHNMRKILAQIRALLCLFTGESGAILEALLNRLESHRPYQPFQMAA
jgi:IS5 family transposase